MNARGRHIARCTRTVALVVVTCVAPRWSWAQYPSEAEKDAIGWTQLMDRLGANAPTGAGVDFTQVEVKFTSPDAYAPDDTLGEFAGKTITPLSGATSDSNHATNVGRNAYGSKGIAPGVTQIDVYESNDFKGAGFLNPLSAMLPDVETRDVENHSWILLPGALSPTAINDLLRRFDYMLDRDDVVAAVGVNNGSGSEFPQAFANSYNSIAVGRTDGVSTKGPTSTDVAGRVKPDIVAGVNRNVSTATAWVSGAAALLVETANAGGNPNARNPETIKATLLAGATKDEFDLVGGTTGTLDDWSRTSTQPLDLRYGAGELNIDNSHRIITAGEFEASDSSDVGTSGWDFDTINAGISNWYFFEVIPEATFQQLSVIATWNRKFDVQLDDMGDGNPFNDIYAFDPILANIDLRLYEATDFTPGTLLDSSISTIDNVEHLFRQDLPSGRYAIEVTSDATSEFAIAWDSVLDAPRPGDANLDGLVDGLDYLIWASNFGATDVGFTDADFNNDDIVDGLDYLIWTLGFESPDVGFPQFSTMSQSFAGAAGQIAAAVPEPSGIALATLALTALASCLARRRRRAR